MSMKDYQFDDGKFKVTPEIKADFEEKGYILVRNLLNQEEVKRLTSVLETGDVLAQYQHGLDDGTDHKVTMCLWNKPGNDVTGMVARSEKVAGTCEELLGGEVYHYHTKVVTKEPRTAGRFYWHQDYSYWYNLDLLYPDLITAYIAVDHCYKANGCLQILEGTHRCGRLDHQNMPGGQMQADPEKVNPLKERHTLFHMDMNPGDAVFFHCNLLHCSDHNTSEERRWGFLVSYNKASNGPTKNNILGPKTQLDKVPNSAILDCKLDWDLEAKDFLDQKRRDAWYEEVHQHDKQA